MTTTPEMWRPVPEWPAYEVSDAGNVRRIGTAWPLSTSRGPCGFYTLSVSDGPRVACVRVGTLVAAAFIGPRREGAAVRRLNGDPGDDRPCNLTYGTRDEEWADHWARYAREQAAGTLPLRCSEGHPYTEQRSGKRSGTWFGSWGELHCVACRDARTWSPTARPDAVRARRAARLHRHALRRARWRPCLDLAAAARCDARRRAKTSTPAGRRAAAALLRDLAAEASEDSRAATAAARAAAGAEARERRDLQRAAAVAERRERRAALRIERAQRRAALRVERARRLATDRAGRAAALEVERSGVRVVGPYAEWARREVERQRQRRRAFYARHRDEINAARRARYGDDEDYRSRLLGRQHENRDALSARQRERYATAPEYRRRRLARQHDDRDTIAARLRERYADDEQYREAVKERNRRANARRAAERAGDPVAQEEYRRTKRQDYARRAAALTPEQKAAKLAARRERQRRRYAEDPAYRARVLTRQRAARTSATG